MHYLTDSVVDNPTYLSNTMAKNAKSLSAMQTLNDPNTTNYYQDDNNGVLYNLVNSKNIDSFTVTFFNEQTFK